MVVPPHSALGRSPPALIGTRIRLRHPGEVLATELAGPAKGEGPTDAGILLGIKRRVECQLQAVAGAAVASSRLHPVI